MFARVAVNLSAVSGLFDYSIPEELASLLQPGSLVTVPFGKQISQGVVLELVAAPGVKDTRAVIDLLDPAPVLTSPQLALAVQMADATLNPLASIVALMLPVGLSQQSDVMFELKGRVEPHPASKIASRLVALLQERGPLRGRQIDSHFSRVEWRKTAQAMVKKGLLSSRNVLPPPRVRPKYIRVGQLAVTPEAAGAEMDSLGSTEQTRARRKAALQFLVRQPHAINVSWIYAESGCNLSDLQSLEERGLIRLFENEIFRDPLEAQTMDRPGDAAITLTPEQNIALSRIVHSLDARRDFLLHGVTGSGKTEIYLRAVEETIKRGRQAIVLVPEIALTAQTVRRFLSRFPGQVGLVHSKLSEGERYDTWRRARSGRLNVIIGARSALFSPLPEIGLIVVDECHDGSYYQAEPPFYHAVAAARDYARLCGAACVLGSATPTIEQRFASENGWLEKLELPRRVTSSPLPPIQVVDMRDQLKTGNRGIFSRILAESLAETISQGEQAILFLNRRGTATYIFCRECGHVLKCPNCETPLTLHVDQKELLLCHRCGYSRHKPGTCPNCGGNQIRDYGLGSERVEAEIKNMFPTTRTLRWDWDTTRRKDSHEMILTHFANHQADVLVGTQMLAKGLDLPLVTLVGIVLADFGLNLPDPFANEKVFQTLTQVAGRAGRSPRGGKVILQTFMPDHYAIQHASKHDVEGFYTRELEYRSRLGYPPFTRLARLEYRNSDNAVAETESRKTADKLKSRIESENKRQTEMIGPVPSFFLKENGLFRWQIVLRSPDPVALLKDASLSGWRVEIDPAGIL